VLGIPFYVWDLSARFHADVVADFVAEYDAGRTPNPCMRCNERSSSRRCSERGLALGFDASVATGPLRPYGDGPGGDVGAAPAVEPGQGPVPYVLGVSPMQHARGVDVPTR
jgi:tRNA-specific 2-thiouridylase